MHEQMPEVANASAAEFSQQIAGQDQLYQMLKEHLEDLTQRHGEHESAMNETITTLVHFLRAIPQLLQFLNLYGVVSKGLCHF